MHFRYAAIVCLSLAGVPAVYAAPAKSDAATDDFTTLFKEWKQLVAKLQRLKYQYNTDPAADKKTIEAEAKATTQKAQEMLPMLVSAAEKSYSAAPNKDKELGDFLFQSLVDKVNKDDYEKAAELAKLLVDNGFENKSLNLVAGLAFFGACDFDSAGKYLQLAKDSDTLNPNGARDLAMIDTYKRLWAREQEIRAKEQAADDLPRVKISTSKGDIVIELFENEAPNATANFISLVEKGFYDGTIFHRVLPGFMAQGGDPKGDGTGGPGYTIPCECYQANHRIHFRGSLSMAHAGKDTGGSQFFLTFLPTNHLDGKHTVFGRVIEGMDVLAKLQRTEPGAPGTPDKPDKIVKATVVRKRKHKYEPIKRLDKAEKRT